MVFEIRRSMPRANTWAVGVTSAVRREGRTSSSIGLAGALAHETGEQVVLVDADFRNPDLAEFFGVDTAPGLYDCLEERCTLARILAHTRTPNLTLVPSGAPAQGGGSSLDTPFAAIRRLPALLAQLREAFTYMVVDMPPLLEGADAAGVAGQLDGVVLVTRAGVSEMLQIEEGVQMLLGANLVATATILPADPTPLWAQRLLKA